MATRSLSDAGSAFWIDPAEIRFKISPHGDLGMAEDGAWDIERRHSLDVNVKHLSIRQRYVEGRGWEDTELFQDTYRRRFKAGGSIRGCHSMAALIEQYYTRVDGLHADMRVNGFSSLARSLPVLLIGRDEVFIGNQGNHRLAIAQVLGLTKFAGRIICRHPLSRR